MVIDGPSCGTWRYTLPRGRNSPPREENDGNGGRVGIPASWGPRHVLVTSAQVQVVRLVSQHVKALWSFKLELLHSHVTQMLPRQSPSSRRSAGARSSCALKCGHLPPTSFPHFTHHFSLDLLPPDVFAHLGALR